MRRAVVLVFLFLLPFAASAESLSRNEMIQVQGLLSDMGYRNAVDGVMGPGTARVIREFQGENGLPVTGEPSRDLIARLQQLNAQGWNRGDAFAKGSVSPSFNCAKASTASEKAVCSDNELALLDRQVAAAYKEAMARVGSTGQQRVKDSQRRWIGLRDSCGSDHVCIRNSMTGQVSILEGM